MKIRTNFLLAAILEVNFEKQIEGKILNKLFAAGLNLLYLRASAVNENTWNNILNNINPEFRRRLIFPASAKEIIQEPRLVLHWKEADRGELRPDMIRPDQVYSTSIHYLPDILKLPPWFRYVFYSPIFQSISKPGYGPPHDLVKIKQTLEKLRREKEDLPQIIGLGGIKVDNVKFVKELGFDGAACMGALWQAADPVQAFKEIKNALHE